MNKTYYQCLPKDYFNHLYARVSEKLLKGENVSVSAIRGCGLNTAINFLLRLFEEDKVFDKVLFFNGGKDADIVEKVQSAMEEQTQRILVVIRWFENVPNKSDLAEELSEIRQPHPEKLVFLISSDHTGIINPELYFAHSRIFVNASFRIDPFDKQSVFTMLKVTNDYYGWPITEKDYERIYELSGGIGRFLKRISKNMAERQMKLDDLESFQSNSSILFQLNYLTKLLMQLDTKQLQDLKLIDKDKKIRSELLRDYFVNRYTNELVEQVGGSLSRIEERIFSWLYENRGKVLSLDKVADLLEMSEEKFSLWVLYKQMSRLRGKLKGRFELENVKGRGYLLKISNIK